MSTIIDIKPNEVYIGLDGEKFDDICTSMGQCSVGKNTFCIDLDTFLEYDITIPYNIGMDEYYKIIAYIRKNINTIIRFQRED